MSDTIVVMENGRIFFDKLEVSERQWNADHNDEEPPRKRIEIEIEEGEDFVTVRSSGELTHTNIKTLPYPGFPTDMQPQVSTVLAIANGTSVVTEGVWDNRYKYVNELRKMGAEIQVDGKTAVIQGVEKLYGAPVAACDLRAGAAMVIAGLCAEGTTTIEDIIYIERGYQDLVGKLRKLGADIVKITEPDPVYDTTIAEAV